MNQPGMRLSGLVFAAVLLLALSTPLPALAAAPEIDWSTYLGGSSWEFAEDMSVDAQGNVYLVGHTSSPDFPGGSEGFNRFWVAKIDPAGQLLWVNTFPLSLYERAYAVSADAYGFVTVAGSFNDLVGSEFTLGFVAVIDPAGTEVIRRVNLADGARTEATDLAVSPDGWIYVILEGDYRSRWRLWRVDLGSLQAEPFGPDLQGRLDALALDSAGNVWVTGQSIVDGDEYEGGMVARIAPSGALELRALLQTPGRFYFPLDIVPGADGAAFVTGFVQQAGSGESAFVARIGPAGELAATRVLGGTQPDLGRAIALAPEGRLLVAGSTESADFPEIEPLADGCVSDCGRDAFAALLAAGDLTVLHSFRLGGTGDDAGVTVAPAAGGVYVAGNTVSADFPTENAFQDQLAGAGDAFAARIDLPESAPSCADAVAQPGRVWPPNGRMVPITLQGVTDPDGDPVRIAVTAIFQDEPLTRRGQPDATGLGSAQPRLRASRSGAGDGRVYHLSFTAMDSAGASCEGTVTVCVPHDRGKRSHCVDGGALVDSAAP